MTGSGNIATSRNPPAEDAHRRSFLRHENRRGYPRPGILAEAPATAQLILSTSYQAVVGTDISIYTPGTYLVTIVCNFYVAVAGGGDCLGTLYQDGAIVDPTRHARLNDVAGHNATVAQHYVVDVTGGILPAVFQIYAKKTAGAGTARCEYDDTVLTIASAIGGGPPGMAGSGAPTDADYLVGTAQAGLSGEIVVGTTPGGELGWTWPSPTVDATHSGTPHTNIPTQTAALNMGSFQINALATPSISTDAATKGYVDGKKVAHILVFAGLNEDLETGVLMPRPGIGVGESGEHGTLTAVPRGKAVAGTAGTGTTTILIEADDSPAFGSATTLHTLGLDTSTEVDDTTLDNPWASGDIWVRARCSAVGATAPKDVAVLFYYYEEVK